MTPKTTLRWEVHHLLMDHEHHWTISVYKLRDSPGRTEFPITDRLCSPSSAVSSFGTDAGTPGNFKDLRKGERLNKGEGAGVLTATKHDQNRRIAHQSRHRT